MVFETRQESGATVCTEVDSLISKIAPQDLEAFKELDFKSSKMGCTGILPDCKVVDLEKDPSSERLYPIEKCFPGYIGVRLPDDGVFETISGIRERIFGSNFDDLSKKVEKSAVSEAVSELSPEDRVKYEAEKKALAIYERRQMMMMSLMHDDEPPPPTPTMEKVQQRSEQISQQARQHVLDHMTPEERTQLEQEQRKYNEDSKITWDRPDAMMIYKPLAEPGPMMKELERRTAADIRSHAYKDQESHIVKF